MAGLGFDKTQARLVADTRLDSHIVEVDVKGPSTAGMDFQVKCERINPAPPGAVTGVQTYMSFWSSLIGASAQVPPGLHFC